MKVLITGANGMLGQDLTVELNGSFEICTRDIADYDICDKEKVFLDLKKIKPDFVVNCAAYTNVDGCESERDLAFSVNSDGVKNIALACKETGSVLYHISTDFVFDGNKGESYVETDDANPLSVYGQSKLGGERHIQAILTRYVIIRTSWLFGKGGNSFVATIIKLSEVNKEIRVVNDQTGCPTYTVDLAKAVKALLLIPAQGIYHVCNAGMCTWYEFAVKIVDLLGRKIRVIPITSQQLARPAVRPSYSVMDCRKIISEAGFHPRPWEHALKEYLISLEMEEK